MSSPLSPEAQAIIQDEEALLAATVSAIREGARRFVPVRRSTNLREDLIALREEAAIASASDLPRLFQEMNDVRALSERGVVRPLPDLGTPYFAHLRLTFADGPRDYCLGRGTYADTAAGVRVVDWRYAPVARLFYTHQEGEDFDTEFPGGAVSGVVTARRVVVIERGVLTRIMAGSIVLVRRAGVWTQEGTDVLAGGAGSAARPGYLGLGLGARDRPERPDVTALLDREQFEAVNTEPDRPLLVIGSAGSGKTTVALHRLAHLSFEDPRRFPADRLRVVVPEAGLARLSRRLLAPLGLERVRVETLDDWAFRTARMAFGGQKIKLCSEPPALVSRLKRHPALRQVILERYGRRNDAQTSFTRMRSRLAEFFSDRTLLARVVELSQGDLPTTAIESTVRHTMLQIATPTLEQLTVTDPERLKTIDGLSIEEGTDEELAGTSDPEDLAIYLFLKARSPGFHLEQIAHLVLDEAEDFSLFELTVLGFQVAARKKSCTLAGDEMQQTGTGFAGWPEMMRTIGAKDYASCRLQVSYRCPRPVVELAQHVLGEHAPPAPAQPSRQGAPVGFYSFPDEAQAHLFLASALHDLSEREPNASVGVIAADSGTAQRVARSLEALPRARLVLNGEFSFEPGVDITDVDNVKGLEFDYVVLPDATASAYPVDTESRRRLHVAMTRTSHQLWVVSSGTRTRLC